MSGNGPPKVLVLYQITNVKGESAAYNAFDLPGKGTVSLSDVKNNCHALARLNSAGANGYHWRVRVDDKVTNPKGSPKYSWWDIQDENARLPVKEVSFTELSHILSPKSSYSDDSSKSSSASSSMSRSLGKALKGVAATVDGGASTAHHANFPRVPIIMFKLLNVTKLYDEHHSVSTRAPAAPRVRNVNVAAPQKAPKPAPDPVHQPPQRQASDPQRQTAAPVPAARVQAPAARRPAPQRQAQVQEGSLMDFGAPAHAPAARPTATNFHNAHTTPPEVPSETRTQKLKREYEQKNKTENRVWDDVDQRWVAVDVSKGAAANQSTGSAPPGGNVAASKTNLKAVSLDNVNTAGKSANVASAVQNRVNDMKESQEKALKEMREREAAKLEGEAEEDVVRQKLEPQIKAWAEEHGKKKQLRALLANLDKVLWPGTKWKQMGLGDLLDDKKVRLAYHKASRVVHPDKTMSLGAEERFIAKRIFDSLAQAKSEWEDSSK
jgi:hypothetical protein